MSQETPIKTRQEKEEKVNDLNVGNAVKEALKNSKLGEDLKKQSATDKKQKDFYNYINKTMTSELEQAALQSYKEKEEPLNEEIEKLREKLSVLKEKTANNTPETQEEIEECKGALVKAIDAKIKLINQDIDFLMTEMPNKDLSQLEQFQSFYKNLTKNPNAPELLQNLRLRYGLYKQEDKENALISKYDIINETYAELYEKWLKEQK